MGGGQYVQQPTAPPQRLVGVKGCSVMGCRCGKSELLVQPTAISGNSCVQ